jgi:hypothetical protein
MIGSPADIALIENKREKLEAFYNDQLKLKKSIRTKQLPLVKEKLFRLSRWLKDIRS